MRFITKKGMNFSIRDYRTATSLKHGSNCQKIIILNNQENIKVNHYLLENFKQNLLSGIGLEINVLLLLIRSEINILYLLHQLLSCQIAITIVSVTLRRHSQACKTKSQIDSNINLLDVSCTTPS
jgi:hypothetical protein